MLASGSNVNSRQLPFVTFLLIIINVCVFIKSYTLECQAAQELRKSPRSLIGYLEKPNSSNRNLNASDWPAAEALDSFYQDWGFSLEDITQRNDFVSLISHMFAHAGFMHLFGNMVMLWGFGVALEDALGSVQYACFYLMCGLVAAFSQAAMDVGFDVPLVGASGAIAGIMGGFFVLFGSKAKLKMLMFIGFIPHVFELPSLWFGGFWLLQQLAGIATSENGVGGVAWMAHLGGVGVGAIAAFWLRDDLEIEIETTDNGEIQIQHERDKPEVTEEQLLEELMDLLPVSQIVTELLGDDAQIPCGRCQGTLDIANPMGDRLLRCTNCQQMTFIEPSLILAAQSQAQQTSVTT